MKTYSVRVNCAGFKDIEVEAENKEEAAELAEKEFICDGNCPEAIMQDIKEVKR